MIPIRFRTLHMSIMSYCLDLSRLDRNSFHNKIKTSAMSEAQFVPIEIPTICW